MRKTNANVITTEGETTSVVMQKFGGKTSTVKQPNFAWIYDLLGWNYVEAKTKIKPSTR